MKNHYDPWYVRLPDGRTIKAKSTASVRHHVEAGQIPLNSLVRRDSNEEWVALVWVAEFADLGKAAGATLSASGIHPAPRAGVAARLDPMRLQTVGARGLIDELVAALDCTLSRAKFVPAVMAAVLLYAGTYLIPLVVNEWFEPPAWVPLVVAAAFAIVVLSVLNALLAKLTHMELAAMRPARLREAMKSFGIYVGPVLVANVLVAGSGLGVLFFLHGLPAWAGNALADSGMTPRAQQLAAIPILLLIYVLAALVWIVVGLCWLLTPAIVVEESSGVAGVREWRQLLRENFGRIVVYEGLTLMLGVAVTLPLSLAVGLALYDYPTVRPAWPVVAGDDANWVIGTVRSVLHGLTAAPLLALMPVANVFIYLNLRYEKSPGR